MSVYKQFNSSDIIVSPLEVNKSFTFMGTAEFTSSIVGIDRFIGKNITGSIFNSGSDAVTGTITTQYQRLIYNSIKELYYSNYLSSSYGDSITQRVLIPGEDEEGNRYIGSSSNQSYDNYLQTTLSFPKFFPTSSNDSSLIGIISIPIQLYGDYIKPNSFSYKTEAGTLTDDGEGNITSGSYIVGNIFYGHGIITIVGNDPSYNNMTGYGSALYGGGIYGGFFPIDSSSIQTYISSSNVTCSFSSSFTIHETQYKCTIRENECNMTFNPTTYSGSNGDVYGYVSQSYFQPFITTVGLYDDDQNLLAVAKLSQPFQSPSTTDLSIIINIDK